MASSRSSLKPLASTSIIRATTGFALPFPDASQDAVYSSHCLEHIADYRAVLQDWFRTLKVGGYLVIIVPHKFLFERKRDLPSRWNKEHRRYYTPSSFMREIEETFDPNSYRIRHLVDNDLGFDYSLTPLHGGIGYFEIELVLEKLPKPGWELDDELSRFYSSDEFSTCLPQKHPSFFETNDSETDRCIVWGPYVSLEVGDYKVRLSALKWRNSRKNRATARSSSMSLGISNESVRRRWKVKRASSRSERGRPSSSSPTQYPRQSLNFASLRRERD